MARTSHFALVLAVLTASSAILCNGHLSVVLDISAAWVVLLRVGIAVDFVEAVYQVIGKHLQQRARKQRQR